MVFLRKAIQEEVKAKSICMTASDHLIKDDPDDMGHFAAKKFKTCKWHRAFFENEGDPQHEEVLKPHVVT